LNFLFFWAYFLWWHYYIVFLSLLMASFTFSPNPPSAKIPLVFPFFSEETKKSLRKAFFPLSRAQKRAVRSVFQEKSIPHAGVIPVFSGDAPVLVLLLGKRKGYDMRSAREEGEKVAALAKQYRFEQIAVASGGLAYSEPLFDAFTEGVFLGTYEFTQYKGKKYTDEKKESGEKDLKKITIIRSRNAKKQHEFTAITDAISFTKDLINTPPSIATPSFIEKQAILKLASVEGIKIQVISEVELKTLGAGGVLAVGQASNDDEKSRFLVLEFLNGKKREKPLALVGKGITYDTGGLSLKPGNSMVSMKHDMAGAATILGALYSLATMNIKKNIVAVLPLAENLLSRDSYKPDDVLTMMNGKTVEITNTDAEGRLVLADALTYAEQTYEPRAMVDLATLTGHCTYAVGDDFTVGLSTNAKLFLALKKAGDGMGEPIWELPLHARYEKMLKSSLADLVNSAKGFKPGTIEGGLFLKNFVTEKTPWCHLDIASVSFDDSIQMATGRNVRMLVEFCKTF